LGTGELISGSNAAAYVTSVPATAPRISVITTVYNAESTLEPTLRSLLAQTYRDFEALIVDDGSTDASIRIAEYFAAKDPRIRIFRQANSGFAGAFNRGLRESRGEFIAMLDHDDLWLPDKLACQVELLDQEQTVGFVGCYSALINADGRCLGWRFGTGASGDVYRRMLFCDLVAGGSVALVRKAAIEQAGFFDPAAEIRGRSDWDEWIRISRLWKFAMVKKILVGYRRSPANFSRNYQHMVEAGKAVLAKAASSDPALHKDLLARAEGRDIFGVFCIGFADGEIASIGGLLRQSLARSWRPVLLSPRRLLVVALFLTAKIMPDAQFQKIWRYVARMIFRVTPGEMFLSEQALRSRADVSD